MKTINVNPSKVVTPVQIGYVTDHNETKLVFETQEETNNYLKLQISDHEYEPIPLTGKEWIVTSTYTDKARKYKAQLMRKIDGEYIANSPIFELVVNNSIYGNETIKEVVPPNFKTAYDNMVDITNQIKEAFENGDFNGNGIVSIEKTNTQENIDTYTITFNDETTSTFTVTNGIDGTTPNIQIGTVTTLESDQQVTVERTGDNDNPVFNFGIPKGEKGDKGDTGLQGSPGIPGEATPEFKQMVEQSTLNATKAERFATQAKQSETKAKEYADNLKESTDDISKLKEDLANKLPKSPDDWEPWTADEQAVARAKAGIVTDTPFELVGNVTTEEAVQSIVLMLSKPCRYISITLDIPPESVGASRNVYFSATDKAAVTECFHRSQNAKTSEINRAIYKSTAEIVGGEIISYGGISSGTNMPVDYTARPIYGVLAGYSGLKADSFTNICVFTYVTAFPAGSSVKIYGC